jgi:hypothetical protein
MMSDFIESAAAKTSGDTNMVGFLTGAIIVLAGILMVATQFSLA